MRFHRPRIRIPADVVLDTSMLAGIAVAAYGIARLNVAAALIFGGLALACGAFWYARQTGSV